MLVTRKKRNNNQTLSLRCSPCLIKTNNPMFNKCSSLPKSSSNNNNSNKFKSNSLSNKRLMCK